MTKWMPAVCGMAVAALVGCDVNDKRDIRPTTEPSPPARQTPIPDANERTDVDVRTPLGDVDVKSGPDGTKVDVNGPEKKDADRSVNP